MRHLKQQIGDQAEKDALHFLKQQGLRLRTKNYTCRLGEIDLIMQDRDEAIVFVEVRYRRHPTHGTSAETITPTKQKRLLNTAHYYLQQHHLYEKTPCRFDVIAITSQLQQATDIQWIKDAIQS